MNFLEAMKFRHACKIFDENKKSAQASLILSWKQAD